MEITFRTINLTSGFPSSSRNISSSLDTYNRKTGEEYQDK